MKKLISLLLALVLCTSLVSVVFAENENEPVSEPDWDSVWESLDLEIPPDVEFDYGTSELYTPEDMVSAIALILEEFGTWEGTEMHAITYMGDECCTTDNVKWMNDLKNDRADAQTEGSGPDPDFTQCICFLSNFHSPKEAYGAWEADQEYTDWQWWLARTDDGPWKLLSWGY